MVHCVFWRFSGGAPASQPASQPGGGGGGGRAGGFQSLPATQPRLGATPLYLHYVVRKIADHLARQGGGGGGFMGWVMCGAW